MGSRVLSICCTGGRYDYLEILSESGGYRTSSPVFGASLDAVQAVAGLADEIRLNGDWSSVIHSIESRPQTLGARLQRVFPGGLSMGRIRSESHHIRRLDLMKKGGLRRACCAIPKEKLESILKYFGLYGRKVKSVVPLPVALAGIVARMDCPADDFLMVWLAGEYFFIAAATPEGYVMACRFVRFYSRENEAGGQDPAALEAVIEAELSRFEAEWADSLGDGPPRILYLLGRGNKQVNFKPDRGPGSDLEVRFGLKASPFNGLSGEGTDRVMALLGNFFHSEEFNFMCDEGRFGGGSGLLFKLTMAALVLMICGAAFLSFSLHFNKQYKEGQVRELAARVNKMQSVVDAIRDDMDRLKPVESYRKTFEQTIEMHPAWDLFFSELEMIMDDDIIIDHFGLVGAGNKNLASPGSVMASMRGSLRAESMEEALTIFGDFGQSLRSSPHFDILGVEWVPGYSEDLGNVYKFNVIMRLWPKGKVHES